MHDSSDPFRPDCDTSVDEENPMIILRRHLVVKRSKFINVFKDMDLGPEPVLTKDVFKEGLKVRN